MRILVVAKHVDAPEAHLFAGLARSGVEILALIRPERLHTAVMEAGGVQVETRVWSRWPWFRGLRDLRERIAAWKPNVVHSLHNDALYNIWRAWPRNQSAVWIAYRGAAFLSRAARRMYRRCGVARIACICESVRAAMLRIGWPAEQLVTIYKGHDPSWYRPAAADRLSMLGLPPNARVVGAAARWRGCKRGDVLVEAFQRLPADPRLHLLMIGEVTDTRLKRLRRNQVDNPRIHFVGFQPDAAALLGACAVTVMPSDETDGLCKAVLESLAQGVPCIVSNVGGPSEIVRDGVEGLCVPPGDVPALAAALRRLLDDEALRRACGERAIARVRDAFHVSATIQRYHALYEELFNMGTQARFAARHSLPNMS